MTLRPYRPDDEAFVLDLYRAAAVADGTEPLLTPTDLRQWLNHPGSRPETDFLVAEVEGQPAGFVGLVVIRGTYSAHRLFARGGVHPAYRRRGLGHTLLQAAEARARARRAELPSGLAAYFDIGCRSVLTGNMALYQAHGLAPVRRFHLMRRDLRQPLPMPALPDGFVIRMWRPEDDDTLLAAHNDAFHDHWGDEPVPPEQWRHYREEPFFRPDQWLLAWTTEPASTLAGFALSWIIPDHEARVSRREALVDEVGVRPAWRRRGLASALLAQGLHRLRAAGLDYAVLSVDTDNTYAAPQLYARLGFVTTWENVVFRKEL